jgi:hypothetical protein
MAEGTVVFADFFFRKTTKGFFFLIKMAEGWKGVLGDFC